MAATPMVKVIYGKPMLPDLARVLACLNEKKIAFELEDMNKGVRMSQDILNLQISYHGHTPMLLDGTDELFGSRRICRHIVDKYGAYGYQYLLGRDPLARVSVEQWVQSEEHKFDPPSSALVFYLAFKIEADVEKTTQSEKKLEKVLNLYERRLGESEFLAGNYFTLADLYHLPNTYYLESSDEFGYLFKNRKNVSRWWKIISQRDSWKKVVKMFEEEGLQFNVPVSNGETDQSSSSPRKNGVRKIGGSEIGSMEEKPKADIPEKKGETKASGNKIEPTTSKEKKDDEAVQSKIEGKKEETPSADYKISGATKGDKGDDEGGKTPEANEPNSKAKEEKPKQEGKEKSGKTDEIKERRSNKPYTEGEKDAHKPHDKDKPPSGDKEIRGIFGVAIKPGSVEKTTLDEKEKPVNIDDIEEREANRDFLGKTGQGKTGENQERKTENPDSEGKNDGFKSDDKDKDSANQVKKDSTPKDGKDITSPGESKNPDTEGKKDGFKSDDKDTDSDNQVKKDSAPNDANDLTSPGESKNSNANDLKEKTN